MTSNAALQDEEAAPIFACTISRDVQNFDLLIEDMEQECGESWGDLSLEDAAVFFDQPEADHLEFVALAMDQEDEADIDTITDLIRAAKSRKIKVLVIAEEVSPIVLHISCSSSAPRNSSPTRFPMARFTMRWKGCAARPNRRRWRPRLRTT